MKINIKRNINPNDPFYTSLFTNKMSNTMKIASYNVNGIRAAIKRGLFEWIREQDYDVVCFQETKALEEQVDESLLEEIQYHH